jgi:hypothetical protein
VLPRAVVGPQPGIGGRGNWADDQWAVDMWLNVTVNIPEITDVLAKGEYVSAMVDLVRIPEAYARNGTGAGEAGGEKGVQEEKGVEEARKDAAGPTKDASEKEAKKKEVGETKATGEAKKDAGKTKEAGDANDAVWSNKTEVAAKELPASRPWRA